MAHEDLNRLLNELLPFAKQMLDKHDEFYPFGGYVDAGGGIGHIGAWTGSEHPPSQEVLVCLRIDRSRPRQPRLLLARHDSDYRRTPLLGELHQQQADRRREAAGDLSGPFVDFDPAVANGKVRFTGDHPVHTRASIAVHGFGKSAHRSPSTRTAGARGIELGTHTARTSDRASRSVELLRRKGDSYTTDGCDVR